MRQSDHKLLYTLRTDSLCCVLSALGASIVSLAYTDKDGIQTPLALSPLSHFAAQTDPSLAGRTIAPCCGRIRNGEILIDGFPYALEHNEGANHLHGGSQGAAFQHWDAEQVSETCVRFTLFLPDGLCGYPGNRRLSAIYRLEENLMSVRYEAESDAPTFIDMTNHVYWDLSGRFDGSAMKQTLEISADRVIRNDSAHLPVGVFPVQDTPLDFTAPVSPASMMMRFPSEEQFSIARGFNNGYILNAAMQKANGFSARLVCPENGLSMTIATDQPAIVFYSGGFLGEDTLLEHGPSVPGCALALEAQGIPDAFHLHTGQAECLNPGNIWKRSVAWRFEETEPAREA